MQPYKNSRILLVSCLLAITATGCQNATLAPRASPSNIAASSRTACQKADSMWNEKIVPSRYEELPPLISPGIFDLLTLLTPSFSVKALTTDGDELEEGRHKLIHAFGTEARLRLVINPETKSGYTGIFSRGAECVIGRFSLAGKPAANTSIPALALKIFIGGNQPSVNLLLMHSVDEQPGHNFFERSFSNVLPPPIAFSKRLLATGFERSAEKFGAKDPNPGRLSLEHLANILPDGNLVKNPSTPYQLIFKPTAQSHSLMLNARADDDFRLALGHLQVGQAVYDIYTLSEGEPPESAMLLGQLILVAPVVSSHYGDEKLYFKHNMEKK
jgi:hypothetical protein